MIRRPIATRALASCSLIALLVSLGLAQQSSAPDVAPSGLKAVRSTPIVGVGGDLHAFLAIRSSDAPPRNPSLMPGSGPESSDASPTWRLYHLPASADPGSVLSAGGRRLTRLPSAWTVAGESLVIAFTERSTAGDAPAIRARRMTVRTGNPLGMFAYEPEGRFEALPPVDVAHDAVSAAATSQRVFLLTWPAQGALDSSGPPRLHRLDHAKWTPAALPESAQAPLPGASSARLFRWSDGVGLRLDSPGREPELWRLPGARAIADEIAPEDWQRVDAPVASNDQLIGASTQLLAIARSDDDSSFIVSAVREGFRATLATVQAPAHAAFFPLGESAIFAWTDPQAEDRLRLIAIDANTGRTIFDDFARTASPVSQRDVQLIMLLAGAALLTALLFALKPEDRDATVQLPAGRTLAPPGRRLAAAALDFAPAVVIASIAWDAPILQTLGVPSPDGQSSPVAPLLTALAIWLAHSAASEWRFGRTLGKTLVRCRTVRAQDGERPSFRQALLRNAVKTLAAPVAALLLIERWRRHPGDLLAGTIVILDAETIDAETPARSAPIEPEREPDAATDTPARGS